MQIPARMSGMVLAGHGDLECLQWRDDLPVPVPGSQQVLIKVEAAAVNNTDINTRIGWYSKAVRGDTAAGAGGAYAKDAEDSGGWSGDALKFPRVQGADCCGRIVAVGSGVLDNRIGERVIVRPMQAPKSGFTHLPLVTFGSEYDGAFAQYAATYSEDAIAVESDLSSVELASFPCAYSTAEGMIQRCGLGGERVLITGGSGGVGSAAIQLAKRRGAHVTAMTSADKAEVLKCMGADDTLDRNDAIPPATFDVIIDLVGGSRFPELLDGLKQGGRYAVAGAIAGPIVELDLRTLYLKDLTFFGCTKQEANVFTDLAGYIERGEIRPFLGATFKLQDLRAAQEAFLSKKYVGKIGLEVS
ncbi:NADPH:quinone reductase-like Zn-dependent oxidoreductase [Roseibium hamelinense]|uniref:NADPH:quinone reductase-like Zn-dependent oxidoreductase n=1 Tax=Roseibium hamelinense TaxID=150831 RepID=A0A562T127_9HYPH|nr:zinc-binding dehydrogenase [Roseibium hamelinense]MTI44688.1 alcohol dehydrogenase [Roseibium hamelinense]TWI87317.1 NADPH:quinone reductase-like Zn-dependent oxidoreductase [Roseibium hamelinense]